MAIPQAVWTCHRLTDASPAPGDHNPASAVPKAMNPSYNLTTTLPKSLLSPFLRSSTEWLAAYHKTAQNSRLFGLGTTALVFNDSERVLLVKRAPGDSMPNMWECPGGGVDAEDPTLVDAAARELEEEAGLRAVSVLGIVVEGGVTEGRPLWWPFTNRDGTKLLARCVFEMGVEGCEGVRLDEEEHTDYVWASEEEVREGWCGEKAIPMSTWHMRGTVLDGFRLRRERREKEKAAAERKNEEVMEK